MAAWISDVSVHKKGGTTMRQRRYTPSITVTIGRHTRLYFAFVTTAPAELDSPATMTLHASHRRRRRTGRRPIAHDTVSRDDAGATRPRRRDGTRPGSGDDTAGEALHACSRGSRARRPQHPAALAVAAPAGALASDDSMTSRQCTRARQPLASRRAFQEVTL